MTMGKSYTKRKKLKNKSMTIAKQTVTRQLAESCLSWWALSEIQSMIDRNDFVLIPLVDNAGYRYGRFRVVGENLNIVYEDNKNSYIEFDTKQIAFFYCYYANNGHNPKALSLFNLSTDVMNLENQYIYFIHKYNIATKKKDWFNQDLFIARISDVKPKLDLAKTNLDTLLELAKHRKNQDINHATTRIR